MHHGMRPLTAALALLLALVAVAVAQAAVLRAPAKVRASAASATSIVVRWKDRARGEIRTEVGLRRRGGRERRGRLSAGATRWSRAGLRPSTRYTVRVRACARKRCGAWSVRVTVTTRAAAASPRLAGCPVFPSDNPWNRDVSALPADPRSAAYVRSIDTGGNRFLHADFGGDGAYGIPFSVVPGDQPKVPITFTAYGGESDPGPYPIPPSARVEGGSDRHLLVLQRGACRLYELYGAARRGAGWAAGSGAAFDLTSNRVRPKGWTSADAAGLPILPGLARYDEVAAGRIAHALRFTVPRTQRGFIFPARHLASDADDPALPPMGLRVRLKGSYDVAGFRGQARVILAALKRYGMIVADNGAGWFVTGAADRRWDDEDLDQLKRVPGTAFEAVKTGPIER